LTALDESLARCRTWFDAWVKRYGQYDDGYGRVPIKHCSEPVIGIDKPTVGDLGVLVEGVERLTRERDQAEATSRALAKRIESSTDEYGVRWRDPKDSATWHTVWGFSTAEEARAYLEYPGKVMVRPVGEWHDVVEEP
jgi:hypothetical protein